MIALTFDLFKGLRWLERLKHQKLRLAKAKKKKSEIFL
jgi:hypothetical protein